MLVSGEHRGSRWAWNDGPWENFWFAAQDKLLVPVFDHVITDPPYTDYVLGRLLAATKIRGEVKVHRAAYAGVTDLGFVPRVASMASRWSIFFCAVEQLGDYQRAAPERWVRSGIYCKLRAMPQLSGDRPANRCEGLAIFHGPGKKRWNNGGKHAFWLARPENRKLTRMATAKPLALCRQLVEQFTDPGETVFDPFGGVASIGVACLLLGRNYVGAESDPATSALALEDLRDPLEALRRRGGEKAWAVPNKKGGA